MGLIAASGFLACRDLDNVDMSEVMLIMHLYTFWCISYALYINEIGSNLGKMHEILNLLT